MDAPGFNKDFKFKMKQKLEYEKIQTANDAFLGLKIEPRANLKPTLQFQPIPIPPKPILFIQVPRREHETFEKLSDGIEKQLNEAGWFLLWAFSNKDEYEIQSFTLDISHRFQTEELKEIILKEIKGK